MPKRKRNPKRRKRKSPNLASDVANIAGVGLLASGGAMALGAIPGQASTNAAQGLQNASSFLPAMGTMAGVAGVMKAASMIEPKKKKRRKYYD